MGEKIIKVVLSFTIPDWLVWPLVVLVLSYRRINYGYSFRRIPLTQGKYAIVDPDDYKRLSKYKWYASKGGSTFYAARCLWDPVSKRKRTIKMHREIINPPYPLVVDHINHNGLDNRKANLRPATKSQNTINKPYIKQKGAHSKYHGVTWQKSNKKWQAQIRAKGNPRIIGYFNDETEAAKAYDETAKKYHKEFAVLNFPPKNFCLMLFCLVLFCSLSARYASRDTFHEVYIEILSSHNRQAVAQKLHTFGLHHTGNHNIEEIFLNEHAKNSYFSWDYLPIA